MNVPKRASWCVPTLSRVLPWGGLLLFVALAAVPSAQAGTITVTNGLSGTGGSGDCTLQEAIQAANTDTAVDACAAGSGTDTIVIGNCTITLTGPFQTDPSDGPIGLPDITTNITIQGISTTVSIIERSVAAGDFSFFRVTGGGVLTLDSLTVRNGRGPSGGALINRGTASIVNSSIENNQATGTAGGGAVANLGPGSLTLTGSTFFGNAALAGPGGAIRNETTLNMTNSFFSGNTASTIGGAMDTFVSGAPVTIDSSQFFGNEAGFFGGAIHHHLSSLTITNSSFFSNTAGTGNNTDNGGGAIEGFGPWTITDSYFDGNIAQSFGNPSSGGAIRYIGDTFTISGCTFSNNIASTSGGAFFLNGSSPATMLIVNSTISANTSSNGAGGIDLVTGSVELNNVTITENSGISTGGIQAGSGSTSFVTRNSIIAGNGAEASSDDCVTQTPAVVTTQGHNVIGDNTNCTISGAGTGDIVGTGGAVVNPMLGLLQDNGGPTPTHALRPSSPAANAGDPGTPGTGGTTCEATDQRGVTRPDPVFGVCDIGAFEGTMPLADVSVTKTDTPDPVTFGQNVTYTITVTNSGPDTAPAVSILDTMPNSTGFVSATPSQGSCLAPFGSQLDCDLGDMTSGSVATVTVIFNANQAGTITNTVFASSSTADDPNFGNNFALQSTTVLRDFDLLLQKTGSPNPVARDNNITYSIQVVNQGGATVNNVTVTDTFSGAAVSAVSATPSQGSCTLGNPITCNLGALTGQNTVTITEVVTATAIGTVSNTATATTTDTDPDTSNNSASDSVDVRGTADLSITKMDSPDPVQVGSNITYTIVVTNNGPDTANGVIVSDNLGVGATGVSIMATQGTCSPGAGETTPQCNLGTLASGASATVTFVASADFFCMLSNVASVAANEFDSVPGNNVASTTTTVTPAAAATADLSITKSDSPDPVAAGLDLTYSIGITNAGPDDASSVMLTDPLPAGVNFVSATPSQGTCSQASGTVTCNLGTVTTSAPASVTIVVQPTAAAGSSISNTVSVTSAATDPDASNNSATATTTVTLPTLIGPSAYLSVNDSPFLAGIQSGTVALETFEDGRLDVPGVTASAGSPLGPGGLTDSVDGDDGSVDGSGTAGWSFFSGSGPTGITFTFSAAALGGLPTQAGIVWTDGNGTTTFEAFDAAGASLGVIGPAAIADGSNSGTTGEDRFFGVTHPGGISAIRISNTGGGIEVDHLQFGPVPVAVNADLTLAKAAAPDPVDAGANVTFTLTVTNAGVGDASGVTVTDPLPAGTSFVSATPSQGTCSGTTTVSCSLGVVATGAQATVDIVALVTGSGTLTNTATVTSGSNELFVFNNSAMSSSAISAMADLSIAKTDAPDPVAVTDNLTYTLTITNAGPSSATDPSIVDTLPAGVTFVSATGTGWTCSQAAGIVTCGSLGLAAGASTNITIVVTPTAVATITNTATVSAEEADPNPNNNTATQDTTVVAASADVQVTKTDSPDPVIINQNLTYTLTVLNNGPQAAQNVVLTDTLPAGPSFVSATAPCTQASGTVTCDLGTLASGAQTVITVVVTPTVEGTLSNTASVTSTTADPNAANNSATASTTVSSIPFSATFPSGQPSSTTVNSGGTVTITVMVTPNQPGIMVTVGCGSTLPPDTTCRVQPQSLTFNDLTPQTVTITLVTTKCFLGAAPPRGPQFPLGNLRVMWPMLFVLTLLLWVGIARRDEQLKRLTPVVVLLLFAVLLGGCATAGPVGSQGPFGTLPGTYTVPITFSSGGQSQTLNFTLSVNP